MPSPSQKTLLVLSGPTAIGKTALAIEWAKALGTHIISADSRQFYKEMAIGTAKPTPEERAAAPHHFVDFLPVEQLYSAGDFERDALAKLDVLFKTQDTVILAGGSGLYVQAVTDGFDAMPADLTIRAQLMSELEAYGIEPLQQQLHRLDPAHHARMDIQNPQRLVRALEVCLASGKTYSSFRLPSVNTRPFNIIKVALDADRQWLYDRINTRVELMLEYGLLEEVRGLIPKRHFNSLKTVGYREFFDHFDGKCTVQEATETLKMNTRRFAKKQLTWLRRDSAFQWFDIAEKDSILPLIQQQLADIKHSATPS